MARVKPKLIQNIFEARYERGYRYLDRCGDVMVILEESLPKITNNSIWLPAEARPAGAKMKCPDLDINVVFDTTRLSLDQSPVDVECPFEDICRYVFDTICAKFDIKNITRFGNRHFYIIAADSVDEAHALSVKRVPLDNWPVREIEGMKARQRQASTLFEAPDRSVGVKFSAMPVSKAEAPLEVDERLRVPPHLLPTGQREALLEQIRRQKQREKEPVAGLMVDIDYYWIKPPDTSVKNFFTKSREVINYYRDAFKGA